MTIHMLLIKCVYIFSLIEINMSTRRHGYIIIRTVFAMYGWKKVENIFLALWKEEYLVTRINLGLHISYSLKICNSGQLERRRILFCNIKGINWKNRHKCTVLFQIHLGDLVLHSEEILIPTFSSRPRHSAEILKHIEQVPKISILP